MKNNKSIIFGLLALFIFSIVIISCQQELLTDTDLLTEDLIASSTDDDMAKADAYILPKGFENKSSDEVISYVNDLSESELEKLAENYRIKTFLGTENLYKTIYNQLKAGELFTDINLSEKLTPEELQRLNNFSLNDVVSSRHCPEFDYPQYKCHDPDWCGSKKYHSKCGSTADGRKWCGISAAYRRYCGYPHGTLVIWWSCQSILCS